ncbi:MAG: rod shape-determining protein MreC [Oscillospiraceae bacterium]
MKDYLKKKGIPLGIAVVLVLVIAAVSLRALDGRAGFLSNITGAVKAPVYKAGSSIIDWLEGIYGYIYKYDQLVAENESLRKQLAQAQEEARLGAEAREENERLRELLNLKEKHSDFVFESAKIISWNASNWASTFTLSKGENSGIEVGDPVVTEYGALVGQVIELGDTWATVRTVIDIDTKVGVLVGETGNAAMLMGEFSLMQEGKVKLTYVTEGTTLLPDDIVLTSGKGGKFPQGLLVGTILEVRTEAGGQNPYAVVEPACDLDSLSQVFVIKEFDVEE